MLTQEFIRQKRDKSTLAAADIQEFCAGIVKGTVSEGQIGSFCMAVFLNGLTLDERVGLTLAMANSGIRLDWSKENLDGPVLDKHSTGGVGDKVSLMLAPIIAACGGYVPMISGRGLGHTGGTLDKMDSIPGYVSQPDLDTLRKVIHSTGCAVIGATKDIAPADKTMYGVRDVTATVESIDLITASILSKKLAAGLDGLILDVKFGTGAFMQDYKDAKALAQSLVTVSNGADLPCRALMTDMNEILGTTAGNAIEVIEAIQFLRNENIDRRLYDITMNLCAEMLVLGKLAANTEDGLKKCAAVLENGKAAALFDKMVVELGGPANICDTYDKHLKLAPVKRAIYAKENGIISAIDTRAVGISIIELGGGRRVAADKIDHAVGLEKIAALGTAVDTKNQPLAIMYAKDAATADKAESLIRDAFTIGGTVTKGPSVTEMISL